MHSKMAIIALTLVVLVQVGSSEEFDEKHAKELFLRKCSSCHGIQDYDLGNRSLKEWQLVVERMSDYGGGDPYTDDEADEIIAYLYLEKYQPSTDDEQYQYGDPAVAPAATQPETAPAIAAIAAPPKPKLRISWRKSKATGAAKFMGYAATALMALMVVIGLSRKTLRRNFKSIHMVLAISLFGALAIHVSVYLSEYGAPNVMWLWSGILASVLIGLVEFGGLLRPKLGVKFIRWHSICGVVGLVLVLVHWFWTPIQQLLS